MRRLEDIVTFVGGVPQQRIKESLDSKAPMYSVFNQLDLQECLSGVYEIREHAKIFTFDKLEVLKEGDIILSLLSGSAAIVGKQQAGSIYSQNYCKLSTTRNLNPKYFIYMINESKSIQKQLFAGLQGSAVMKYTIKQYRELSINILPLEKQQIIGDVYVKQLRLRALKNKNIQIKTNYILAILEKEIG